MVKSYFKCLLNGELLKEFPLVIQKVWLFSLIVFSIILVLSPMQYKKNKYILELKINYLPLIWFSENEKQWVKGQINDNTKLSS